MHARYRTHKPELQFVFTPINIGNLPNRKTFPTNVTHILHIKECPVNNMLTSEPAQDVLFVFTIDTPLNHEVILKAC